MTKVSLSDDDKQVLLEQAITALENRDYRQALEYLMPLENCVHSDAFIYNVRAAVYSGIRDWDHAIQDIQKMIHLNPDDADGYLRIGICLTLKLSDAEPERFSDHRTLIEEVLEYYDACLERDPSNRTAWMNAAETYLFIRRWDDALSYSALGNPYIHDTVSKLTHEWIACLALALAGEPISDEDRRLLDDPSIRIPEDAHDIEQVNILLNELKNDNFDSSRLNCARNIHNTFLKHFKVSPTTTATVQA